MTIVSCPLFDANVERLAPRSTQLTPTKRTRLLEEDSEEVDEEQDLDDIEVETKIHCTEKGILYLTAQWEEPSTLTKRLNVYIHMFTGIEKGMFSIDVIDDGTALEYVMEWPRTMTDVKLMHRKWRKLPTSHPDHMSDYHVEMQAFERELQKYRANMGEKITTTWKLPLPIRVQKQKVSQSVQQYQGTGCAAIYLRLKGVDQSYGIVNDDVDFEVV